jgi:hypothetical protein
VDPNLSPISRSFLRFYHTRMRLALSELKLVLAYSPLLGAQHILMLDCANAALDILRHIITDFAPNGYLAYGQDFVPFATAYAGAWLFKVSHGAQLTGLSLNILFLCGDSNFPSSTTGSAILRLKHFKHCPIRAKYKHISREVPRCTTASSLTTY